MDSSTGLCSPISGSVVSLRRYNMFLNRFGIEALTVAGTSSYKRGWHGSNFLLMGRWYNVFRPIKNVCWCSNLLSAGQLRVLWEVWTIYKNDFTNLSFSIYYLLRIATFLSVVIIFMFPLFIKMLILFIPNVTHPSEYTTWAFFRPSACCIAAISKLIKVASGCLK